MVKKDSKATKVVAAFSIDAGLNLSFVEFCIENSLNRSSIVQKMIKEYMEENNNE